MTDSETVRSRSSARGEPAWMLEMRLEALRRFETAPMPGGVGDLSEILVAGIADIAGDLTPHGRGVGRADRASGIAGDETEEALRHNREELERRGVVFCDMGVAVRDHSELVERYFGDIVGPTGDKFSALNTALWSGGTFIYVPPGVDVEVPLEADLRVDADRTGRFRRTLIIAGEGSKVRYIEGCSAPVYTSDALQSAVVEIVVKPSADVTCTTIQNWSSNVFNLVTKQAQVEAEGHVTWIDGNIGSRLTKNIPSVRLVGPKASGEVRSVAYAGTGQHQDTGATIVHAAPETSSTITAKSISKDGGRSTCRSLVSMSDGANGGRSHVHRNALLLDDESVFEDRPEIVVRPPDAELDHATTVSRVSADQLFYLMSRGLSEEESIGVIVNGFIEPVTRTLPMEYAIEWSRLIELQMGGSVG